MREIKYLLLVAVGYLGGCGPTVDGSDPTEEVAGTSELAMLESELEDLLASHAPDGDPGYFAMPLSSQLSAIPQSPLNPLTPQKVQLGKLLYHETAMAQDSTTGNNETYSCASCHFAQAGFQANRAQGVADGGSGFFNRVNNEGTAADVQPIRSPTSMNTAYQELMLWNGQFGGGLGNDQFGDPSVDFVQLNASGLPGLEVQAIKGLAVHRMASGAGVVEGLGAYQGLFDAVFGPGGGNATRHNAGLAIAAFERTVLANQAPFQRWLRGNPGAMSEAETRGAVVFFGDGGCVSCHTGPALSSMTFHSLGMGDLDESAEVIAGGVPDGTRRGRGGFTNNPDDDYKFKTPQLYNLAASPFYGHGATFSSIAEVVEYKNDGVADKPNANLASEFAALNLTQDQQDDLVAFLTTGLYDANLDRYVPASLPSGLCTPHNDPVSRADLGCD